MIDMGRKLARAVAVGLNVYRPGDEPSAEDAKLITNPAAWGDGDETEEVRAISPDSTPIPTDDEDVNAGEDSDDEEDSSGDEDSATAPRKTTRRTSRAAADKK